MFLKLSYLIASVARRIELVGLYFFEKALDKQLAELKKEKDND